MPVNYKVQTLLKQSKLTADELLKRINVSIKTLLELNNIQLAGADWENLNFKLLEETHNVNVGCLTIPENLVNPHRTKLLSSAKFHIKDILESAMWATLTRLRHEYEPHEQSLEYMKRANAHFYVTVSNFPDEDLLVSVYQDAVDDLKEEPKGCGEAGIIRMTNFVSKEFADTLSAYYDRYIAPILTTVPKMFDSSREQIELRLNVSKPVASPTTQSPTCDNQ